MDAPYTLANIYGPTEDTVNTTFCKVPAGLMTPPPIGWAVPNTQLYILDSKGKKLGRIVHGHPATTNVAFGGDDWKTLYFTTRSSLFSVNIKVAGTPVPVKKKSA